jgi:hypothetical protein
MDNITKELHRSTIYLPEQGSVSFSPFSNIGLHDLLY